MRLGIIARSDNTGLGYQTKQLTDMLNPSKVMLIDFSQHNSNTQHPEWYNGYEVINVLGIPDGRDIDRFLKDIDVVLSCETFYNNDELILKARDKGIKTILQYNYELFGNLSKKNMELPNVLVSPSLWKIDDIEFKFGRKAKVVHLAPPTNINLFDGASKINRLKTHNRILHIGGKRAAQDRNGTNTIVDMLKYSKADYELVIKTQTKLDINLNDDRIVLDYNDSVDRESMYTGFDAMVLPRRYAGLCLPMNESLLSALPVFMTNISPNNKVLPERWLVESHLIDEFRAKTLIQVYEANLRKLAELVDNYVMLDDQQKINEKQEALCIGYDNFSPNKLLPEYIKLINE
jgi:hypothetical protein